MNRLDKQYTDLLQSILDYGVEKKDRTGTGTKSIFGYTIRHKMSDGFPLLTTKKMAWKTMVTELLWFLRGDTNIKFLVDNGCHIWDGDAYKNYLKHNDEVDNYWIKKNPEIKSRWKPYSQEEFINKIKTDDEFANKWGELGPVYGKQWRKWSTTSKMIKRGPSELDVNIVYEPLDQIKNLINDLKTNPDSRRLMVNAWNVGELDQMVLPPCHYGFQVYTRELSDAERLWMCSQRHHIRFGTNDGPTWYNPDNPDRNKLKWMTEDQKQLCDSKNIPTRAISLMWNQRSVDTFLGLPFNIASYGLLLEIIAKIVNMVPDELIGNLGDVHLYSNHIEQAKEQIGRKYTPEERHEMLKTAMGEKDYKEAVDELMPFGGGLSLYYEHHKIPYHSREPFGLPKLKLPKTDNFWNGFDVSLFGHLDPTDFQIENYQSHPSIKAPLSN